MQPWHLWAFELTSGGITSPTLLILAYLDPGTGSYAIQLLLATLFGGLFALKQSWAGLKMWASARFGGRSAEGDLPSIRPGIGNSQSRVARPRGHGQPTAEID